MYDKTFTTYGLGLHCGVDDSGGFVKVDLTLFCWV